MTVKSEAELFKCPNCGSQYKLVRVEADPAVRITDADPEYPALKGTRNDRNLAAAWAARGGAYVWNAKGFAAIDPAATLRYE